MAASDTRPIRFVVEGQSEYHAVPVLVRKLGLPHAVPAVFHGQGTEMSPDAVARRAFTCILAQLGKRASRVLVVLDREARSVCAPKFARDVLRAVRSNLKKAGYTAPCSIAVVCADRKFENWLLADRNGLSKHADLKDASGKQQPGNVDGTDGEAELRKLMKSRSFYRKGEMTGKLAEFLRIERREVQRRSRSLRKFVKEVGA